MADTKQTAVRLDTLEVVAAALEDLGEATAAAVAERAELAYSTVAPKLRALEQAGRATPIRADGRTVWRPSASDTADSAGDAATSATRDYQAGDEHDLQPASDRKAGDGEPGASETQPVVPPHAHTEPRDEVIDAHEGVDHTHTAHIPNGDDSPAACGDAVPDSSPGSTDDGDHPATSKATEQASPDSGPTSGSADLNGDHVAPQPDAAKARRGKGELRQQVLDVLHASPDSVYGPHDVSKLIPDASQGAIRNALDKLTEQGCAALVQEKPVRYQAA